MRLFRMVIADDYFLVLLQCTPLYTSDCYTSYIIVIVYRRHKHLERRVGISLGCGNVVDDRLKQRLKVRSFYFRRVGRGPVPSRAEKHGRIQLVVGRVEVYHELQHFVDDFRDAPVWPVDLVYNDNNPVAHFHRARQDKPRLGKRAFSGVDQEDNSVDHLQYALHFSAEIGVSWRIHDIYFDIAILHGRIFGQNSNSALTFQLVRIQSALLHDLVFTVYTALFEHLVYQRRFTVVDVSDNGDVPDISNLQSIASLAL